MNNFIFIATVIFFIAWVIADHQEQCRAREDRERRRKLFGFDDNDE